MLPSSHSLGQCAGKISPGAAGRKELICQKSIAQADGRLGRKHRFAERKGGMNMSERSLLKRVRKRVGRRLSCRDRFFFARRERQRRVDKGERVLT